MAKIAGKSGAQSKTSDPKDEDQNIPIGVLDPLDESSEGEENQEEKKQEPEQKAENKEKPKAQEQVVPDVSGLMQVIASQQKMIESLSTMVTDMVSKPVVREELAKTLPVTKSSQFNKDDIMEKDVLFFAPISQFGIYGEIDGEQVSVMFSPIHRYLDNKTKKVECLSGVRINSKRLYEFLINYPSYGIKFYKNGEDDQITDVDKFEFYQSASNTVSALNQTDLYRECRKYDIEATQDINKMRKRLAVAIGTEQYEKSQKNLTAKMAENAELFNTFNPVS